jgi:hypothetical protein
VAPTARLAKVRLVGERLATGAVPVPAEAGLSATICMTQPPPVAVPVAA